MKLITSLIGYVIAKEFTLDNGDMIFVTTDDCYARMSVVFEYDASYSSYITKPLTIYELHRLGMITDEEYEDKISIVRKDNELKEREIAKKKYLELITKYPELRV